MLLAERIIPTGIMARSKMTVHPSREFQEKAIALIAHSLDPSLFTQLIVFHSLDFFTTASFDSYAVAQLLPLLPQPTIS